MDQDGRSYLHQNKMMDIQILNNTMGNVETVADPGFPVGVPTTRRVPTYNLASRPLLDLAMRNMYY